MKELLSMNLYIGINGCSLKTPENIEVARQVPLDRLMLESRCFFNIADSPYCEINKSHASHPFVKTTFDSVDKKKWSTKTMVKSRNEPCKIVQVAEVLAEIKKIRLEEIVEAAYLNSVKVFGRPSERQKS